MHISSRVATTSWVLCECRQCTYRSYLGPPVHNLAYSAKTSSCRLLKEPECGFMGFKTRAYKQRTLCLLGSHNLKPRPAGPAGTAALRLAVFDFGFGTLVDEWRRGLRKPQPENSRRQRATSLQIQAEQKGLPKIICHPNAALVGLSQTSERRLVKSTGLGC